MLLKSSCPHCKATVRVKEDHVSKRVRCPQCKRPFEVKSVEVATTESLSDTDAASETIDSRSYVSSYGRKEESTTAKLERLGRFQIREVLGQGGFGRVYRAYDPQLDREVALKVPVFGPEESRKVQRFLAEAQSAARLRHPCIVPIYDSGQADGRYFIASQFVRGEPLARRIKTQLPELRQAVEWVRLLAGALAYAHNAGVIHRDVKPDNIMIDEHGTPQIMDFGLAKRLNEDSAMTTDGTVIGTPAYMPPEQARGDIAQVGPRSDQYSLGVVLYELMTGQKPFDGPPHSVLVQVIGVEPPAPRKLRTDLPDDLEAICQVAMNKSPSERYASCSDFADDLARWLAGVETRACPLTTFQRASRWCRRNPMVAGLAATVVVLLGVTFATTSSLLWISTRGQAAASRSSAPNDRGDPSVERSDSSPVRPSKTNPVSAEPKRPTAPLPAIAPFDEEQAKAHQQAWAKYLELPVEFTNSIGMKFNLIPPGEFLMGATQAEIGETLGGDTLKLWKEYVESEGPQHKVILTNPVWLGVHEVTQKDYVRVMGRERNPSYYSSKGRGKSSVASLDTDPHPVDSVTWTDAIEFCRQLSQLEGLEPCYSWDGDEFILQPGTGYRLPTEAEWEFACRAGTTTTYSSGSIYASLPDVAWFDTSSSNRPHSVGTLLPNSFGLFDMHGNVREWVQDRWDADYYGRFRQQPAVDPPGTEKGTQRVLRGGDFSDRASTCRSACRRSAHEKFQSSYVGFRVALMIQGKSAPTSGQRAQGRDPSAIVADLSSADSKVRTAALTALGKLGSAGQAHASAIENCIDDRVWDVKVSAVRALRAILGPQNSAKVFERRVNSLADSTTRSAALVGLEECGEHAMPIISRAIDDKLGSIRYQAITTAIQVDVDGALNERIRLKRFSEQENVEHAARKYLLADGSRRFYREKRRWPKDFNEAFEFIKISHPTANDLTLLSEKENLVFAVQPDGGLKVEPLFTISVPPAKGT